MTTIAPATNTKRKNAVAPLAVKTVDTGARTFTGLASTWDLDDGGDIVHQGAYARTLDHWRQSGGKRIIPLIDMHDYWSIRRVVGKLIEASETAEGLLTTWQIIEGLDGDEALNRIKGGFINGLSIGYEVVASDSEEITTGGETTWVRHLRELKLVEVSLVIWGMNPNALIDTATVKSMLFGHRAGDPVMTEEARALLIEGVKTTRDELSALLDGVPKDTPPALAPDAALALKQRLLGIKLRRLATRATARPGTLGDLQLNSNPNDKQGAAA